MPIMTGAEAAAILKRTVPRMKIILFSSLRVVSQFGATP
jgi:hypothetical protein